MEFKYPVNSVGDGKEDGSVQAVLRFESCAAPKAAHMPFIIVVLCFHSKMASKASHVWKVTELRES